MHHCCSVKPPRAPCGCWAFLLKSKRVIGAYWWQDLCYSAGQPRGSCCSKFCSSCVSWHPSALQAVPMGVFSGSASWFSALFVGMPGYCGIPLELERKEAILWVKMFKLNQGNGESNFRLSLLVIEKSMCIDGSPQSSIPCLYGCLSDWDEYLWFEN